MLENVRNVEDINIWEIIIYVKSVINQVIIMAIKNIQWTCEHCKSVIDMDNPLLIKRSWSIEQIDEVKKEYQRELKLYKMHKDEITVNKIKFEKLVKEHNKKFWCNNWVIREYTNEIYIRIDYDTKWYRFGKCGQIVKSFVLKNKKPYKFEDIQYGIECPVCYAVAITKSETMDLSK